MAARLSVIMVHTPSSAMTQSEASPVTHSRRAADQVVEAVVGKLIGFSGIDLTLIGPIAQLSESSTDRLTLDSIQGDVAMLDWQTAPQILSDLASVGFSGQRCPHRHDPDAPSATRGRRRIYAFDLNRFLDADQLISALSQLRSTLDVRTFTLSPQMDGTGQNGRRVGAGSDTSEPKPKPTAETEPPPASKSGPNSQTGDRSQSIGVDEPVLQASPRPDVKSGGAVDLDDLLDQLDQMDP